MLRAEFASNGVCVRRVSSQESLLQGLQQLLHTRQAFPLLLQLHDCSLVAMNAVLLNGVCDAQDYDGGCLHGSIVVGI